MDAPQIKYREKLAEHLIKKLNKRRMAASFSTTCWVQGLSRAKVSWLATEGALPRWNRTIWARVSVSAGQNPARLAFWTR